VDAYEYVKLLATDSLDGILFGGAQQSTNGNAITFGNAEIS
jgi:hypothetical protein